MRGRGVVAAIFRGCRPEASGGFGAPRWSKMKKIEIEGAEAGGGGGWTAFPRLAHVKQALECGTGGGGNGHMDGEEG